jgi:hypothetical protein
MTSASGSRQPARRFWLVTVVVTVTAVACQVGDDDAEPSNGLPGGTGGSDAAPAAGTGGTSSNSAGTEQTADLGPGGGGTIGGHSADSGGQPSGGESNVSSGGACDTGSEGAACATCLRGHCCSEWRACSGDTECSDCTSCLDNEMDLGSCVVMNLCDIAPQATADVLRCGLDECVSECGFD